MTVIHLGYQIDIEVSIGIDSFLEKRIAGLATLARAALVEGYQNPGGALKIRLAGRAAPGAGAQHNRKDD